MPVAALPRPQAPISDRAGLPTVEWYSYFLQLRDSGGLTPAQQNQLDDLAARVLALEEAGSSGGGSIQGVGSIVTPGAPPGIVQITLEGDTDTPGNTWYYGTAPDGSRGWFSLADGFSVTADLTRAVDGTTGITTFGLADLANSGTGTAIYKTTRDAKGRTSGQVTANTDDLTEGASNLYFTNTRADARITVQKGQPNGLATLGADSKIPSAQLPALAITETFVVASQAAQLALAAQEGDVAVRTDLSKNYIHNAGTSGTMSDWTELLTPAAPVQSVNGKTGNVTLVTDDLPESGTPTNQWFTAARVRAVVLTGLSTATNAVIAATDSILVALGKLQAQLNGKEPSITAGTSAQFWRGDKTWASELLGPIIFRMDLGNNEFRPATTTASVSSLSIGGQAFYGANGTGDALGGTFNFRANQLWTSTANGCDFAIRLITTGTTTLAERFRVRGDGAVVPGSDNAQTCGNASLRWSTVYAGTGTINTSDAREKTPVVPLSAAELACAIQLGREIGWFQFHEAVAAKGEAARQHVGMTVQRAIEVMQQHELDPFRWGFICHDTWPAQERIEDEDGTVIQEARAAGNRYSFRQGELHAFILRGLVQRQDDMEARILTLESGSSDSAPG